MARHLPGRPPRAGTKAGVDPKQVAAISVSDQAPSLVAVDRSGDVLCPALIWMDRRSEEQCAWLRGQVGEDRIAAINGGRIDPYFLAPKLLWFREHAPDLYAALSPGAAGQRLHRPPALRRILHGQCRGAADHAL